MVKSDDTRLIDPVKDRVPSANYLQTTYLRANNFYLVSHFTFTIRKKL